MVIPVDIEGGKLAEALNGVAFATNGGRSKASEEDQARGQLFFEGACLAHFCKEKRVLQKFGDLSPGVPEEWVDCCTPLPDGQFWGRSCSRKECDAFTPSVVNVGETSTDPTWVCLNCNDEDRYKGILVENRSDPLHLTLIDAKRLSFHYIRGLTYAQVLAESARCKETMRELCGDVAKVYNSEDGVLEEIAKTERELAKVKDPEAIFSKYKGLSHPIEPSKLKQLFTRMENKFGVRTATSSPLKFTASTSKIHGALIELCKEDLKTQLDAYFAWFSDVYGDADTLFGLHCTRHALESVAKTNQLIEHFYAYCNYYGMKQRGDQTLVSFLTEHDKKMAILVKARHGQKVEDEASLYFFLWAAQPPCVKKLMELHKQSYKGAPLEWGTLRQIVDSIPTVSAKSLDPQSTVKATITSEIEKQVKNSSLVSGHGDGGSADSGDTFAYGGSGEAKFVPMFPCGCCGSTKENPLPSGHKHHFENECPWWDLKVWVEAAGDKVVVKFTCNKKSGCPQNEPHYQKEETKSGKKPRWTNARFKQSKHYKFLLRRLNAKRKTEGQDVLSSKIKKAKKQNGKKKEKKKQAKPADGDSDSDEEETAAQREWKSVMGFGFHEISDNPRITLPFTAKSGREHMLDDDSDMPPLEEIDDETGEFNICSEASAILPRTMSSAADVADKNRLFTVSPMNMQMPEEDCVKLLKLVAKLSTDGVTIKRTGPQGDGLSCFLLDDMLASAVRNESMPKGDKTRLLAYEPTKEEVEADKNRTQVPRVACEHSDGAIQRSLELFIKLKQPSPKADHLQWSQMLDSGAVGNYQAANLTYRILQHCEKGDDGPVLKVGFNKCCGTIHGADPEAKNGMTAVIYSEQLVSCLEDNGSIFTQKLNIDTLNRSAVVDIRGIKQTSVEEGCLRVHDGVGGTNMRKEYYQICMPSATPDGKTFGTVKLPVYRKYNTWGPLKLNVMLGRGTRASTSEVLSTDIQLEKAKWMLHCAMESEKDELKLDQPEAGELVNLPSVPNNTAVRNLPMQGFSDTTDADNDVEGCDEEDFDICCATDRSSIADRLSKPLDHSEHANKRQKLLDFRAALR